MVQNRTNTSWKLNCKSQNLARGVRAFPIAITAAITRASILEECNSTCNNENVQNAVGNNYRYEVYFATRNEY